MPRLCLIAAISCLFFQINQQNNYTSVLCNDNVPKTENTLRFVSKHWMLKKRSVYIRKCAFLTFYSKLNLRLNFLNLLCYSWYDSRLGSEISAL